MGSTPTQRTIFKAASPRLHYLIGWLCEVQIATFPSPEWIDVLKDKLNSDEQYARIAKNWEGDVSLLIEPDETLSEPIAYYLDLWHGKCRTAFVAHLPTDITPAFTIKSPYHNFVKVLKNELDPMQAMLTRKLGVQGSMSVLMRNIPSILDFVRCAREITDI